ncbi:MAG: hypothetical protein HY558_06530 [Euryarchaeota archaeon]|nr:hypothetical protein [Euryarchaeota archaeon]
MQSLQLSGIESTLVPFPWFLAIVGLAAFILLLMVVYAFNLSRIARMMMLSSGGYSSSASFRSSYSGPTPSVAIRRRARQRQEQTEEATEGAPAAPAAALKVETGAEMQDFLKFRAQKRLGDKGLAVPKQSVLERLGAIAGTAASEEKLPGVPEEELKRLNAREETVLTELKSTPTAPTEVIERLEKLRPATAEAPRTRTDALRSSRRMTDDMLANLQAQMEKGLITRETFEELKGRLSRSPT